jgi:hypothetical protein
VKKSCQAIQRLFLIVISFAIIALTNGLTRADSTPSTSSGQAGSPRADSAAFIEGADFDKNIPTPQSVIGFPAGERAVTYEQLVKYLKALDQAGDRVKLVEYGKTYEGRSLYYLIITSKENHKRLDQIKADNEKLADPRKLKNPADADKIIENMPAVAFLNYGIHGDELSSSDAAMYVAYHLAASKDKQTQKLLDELVIIIEPMMNPDGRERFLGQIRQMTGAVENPDVQAMHHQALWSRGRGNHYLFDLNRDWLVQLQAETRATAPIILSWNPHLLVDSHEQGPYDTYLFDPPNDPVNSQISESITKWRKTFSEDQSAAFNKFGWSYFTRDWYSDWGPIYTNSWANLLGAVGILYEQGRADSGSVKQLTGSITTYRETVHHHIVSTFANLQTLAANRKQILKEFFEDRKWAINEPVKDGKFLIIPQNKDADRWKVFIDTVRRHGIEVGFAAADFEAEKLTDLWGNIIDKKQFPKGAAVINWNEPHRRLLDCLLGFDQRMSDSFLVKERTEITNYRGSMIYDMTSWSLPIAFGLDSYRAGGISDVQLMKEYPLASAAVPAKKGNFGYIIDFSGSQVYPVIVRLFEQNCRLRAATKPFKFAGKNYEGGTILLRSNENPDNLFEILQKAAGDFHFDIQAVDTALVEDGPDLGTSKFVLLTEPRAAIASQWPISSGSFGSVWFLLDNQVRLKCSIINIQNLGEIDLRTYNVLVLPDSYGSGEVLGKAAVRKIKQWVENGGTLIAIGGSAAFAADANNNLSSARLGEDVLDKLPEYQEALLHEKEGLNIKIDSNSIWGKASESAAGGVAAEPNKTIAKDKDADKAAGQGIDKLKRDDEWKKLFSPTGVFLSATSDTENWLSFGLDEKLPVFFEGSDVFMEKQPVRCAVRFAGQKNLRLSGLLWPEARERIADTAYATTESVGRGQIILFASDPTYRTWLSAQQRLFLNACLLGPGLGTSPPKPW